MIGNALGSARPMVIDKFSLSNIGMEFISDEYIFPTVRYYLTSFGMFHCFMQDGIRVMISNILQLCFCQKKKKKELQLKFLKTQV